MRDCALPYMPSQTSTRATDGHSRSIASASSLDRLGRRATSRKLLPDPTRLSAPHFWTMIVSGPSWLIESRSELSNPRRSDVMPTIDVMPMTTPRTVSAERILFVRSVSTDIVTISRSSPARSAGIYYLSVLTRSRRHLFPRLRGGAFVVARHVVRRPSLHGAGTRIRVEPPVV